MQTTRILFLILAPTILCGAIASNSGRLAMRVADLEAQVAEMQQILQYVHVETEMINGLVGPHWVIEGANVHVLSGAGSTREGCRPGLPNYPSCESLTGLGNLIVGYNEETPTHGQGPFEFRTGSHNLVVGERHTYTAFGGFVAGRANRITGESASITAGNFNEASGWFSSVTGGSRNFSTGIGASISGGLDGEAPEDFNWAAGNLFESN